MNELLTQFSAEDDQPLLGNCLRAQAEALWSLGERARAEEQYETLIGRLPSFAWATLAWRIATGSVRSRRRSPRSTHGGSDLSARVGRRRGGKSGLDQAA